MSTKFQVNLMKNVIGGVAETRSWMAGWTDRLTLRIHRQKSVISVVPLHLRHVTIRKEYLTSIITYETAFIST